MLGVVAPTTLPGDPAGPLARHLQGLGIDAEVVAADEAGRGERTGWLAVVARPCARSLAALGAMARATPGRVLALVPEGDADPADPRDAWRLLRGGADDVLAWQSPRRSGPALAARLQRWREIDTIAGQPLVRDNLIGDSPRWRETLATLIEVGHFSDTAILLHGETGTGKELAARLIHELDPRPRKGELVVVDCTTIVPDLSGSELFGHERGAFTGAEAARDGAFALAHGGTLFLDEVGELPPDLQAALLRVIQEGTFKRVGSNRWQRTAFRLVCATHRDLVADAAEGRFRTDLYFRLATSPVTLPPLRDRPQDILPLARHFAAEGHRGARPPELTPAVAEMLRHRAYPGNVRELRQVVLRMLARHPGQGPLTAGLVPRADRIEVPELAQDPGTGPSAGAGDDWRAGLATAVGAGLRAGVPMAALAQAARDVAVELALQESGGNLRLAAGRLGVSERALQLRRASSRAGLADATEADGAADGEPG